MHHVLQLDQNGVPQSWLSPQEAAVYYATDCVSWTIGEVMTTLRGGTNSLTGRQSAIDVHPVMAVRGASPVNLFDAVPTLTNEKLFARERFRCSYCGDHYPGGRGLTRDHIWPRARGGDNSWTNCTSSCKFCNAKKACRSPEEANMPLLFAPYTPSVFEDYLLRGRVIHGDAHDYLASRISRHSRLRAL